MPVTSGAPSVMTNDFWSADCVMVAAHVVVAVTKLADSVTWVARRTFAAPLPSRIVMTSLLPLLATRTRTGVAAPVNPASTEAGAIASL